MPHFPDPMAFVYLNLALSYAAMFVLHVAS